MIWVHRLEQPVRRPNRDSKHGHRVVGEHGDSATVAELCALLSALTQSPLKQGFAITGSMNQYGEVQAIGGVNEKIEGFFRLCKARGLTGDQGVIIPKANIRNLMLNKEVISAVEKGEFAIHAVSKVDEALSLLTGVNVGQEKADGHFPKGSINAKVVERLKKIADSSQKPS